MNISTKIIATTLLVALLSLISACDSSSPPSREALVIDGSSVQAYRASHERIVESLADNNPRRLVSFLEGYFSVKIRAQEKMAEEDIKAEEESPDTDLETPAMNLGERQEKLEMQILDGLSAEEVIELGEVYKDTTGIRLIPSAG